MSGKMKRRLSVHRLPTTIFKLLRQMDEEATFSSHGLPTGLRWYSEYDRLLAGTRSNKRDRIEDAICDHLGARLLMQFRISLETRTRYPRSTLRTDMVLRFPDADETLWLEVKGAWSYLNDFDDHRIVHVDRYAKYLYGRPHKSVEHDVHKLSQLTRAEATHAAILLIGFDARRPTKYAIADEELDKLRQLAGLRAPTWTERYARWRDRHQSTGPKRITSDYRVRCWWWCRRVEEKASRRSRD